MSTQFWLLAMSASFLAGGFGGALIGASLGFNACAEADDALDAVIAAQQQTGGE